jgi:hypothetical protein
LLLVRRSDYLFLEGRVKFVIAGTPRYQPVAGDAVRGRAIR